jgi:hypothetical protein
MLNLQKVAICKIAKISFWAQFDREKQTLVEKKSKIEFEARLISLQILFLCRFLNSSIP